MSAISDVEHCVMQLYITLLVVTFSTQITTTSLARYFLYLSHSVRDNQVAFQMGNKFGVTGLDR